MERPQFEYKLGQCQRHLENFVSIAGPSCSGFSLLELATGSYPIVPIGAFLCGASRVWTIDTAPRLTRKRVVRVLDLFCQYSQEGKLAAFLPMADGARVRFINAVAARLDLAVDAMLRLMQIVTLRGDATSVGLPAGTVDLFVSNSTLHQFPQGVLSGIFSECARLASRRAVMSHHINMRDHYADFDRSITPYNFMKFASVQWRRWNSSLHYQNRLRLSDYRKLHENSGWKIKLEDHLRGSPEELRQVRLAQEFQSYSQEDLLTLRSWLASSRA